MASHAQRHCQPWRARCASSICQLARAAKCQQTQHRPISQQRRSTHKRSIAVDPSATHNSRPLPTPPTTAKWKRNRSTGTRNALAGQRPRRTKQVSRCAGSSTVVKGYPWAHKTSATLRRKQHSRRWVRTIAAVNEEVARLHVLAQRGDGVVHGLPRLDQDDDGAGLGDALHEGLGLQ